MTRGRHRVPRVDRTEQHIHKQKGIDNGWQRAEEQSYLYESYPGNQHSRSNFLVAALLRAPDTMLMTW